MRKRDPVLSLDEANDLGPGKVCDLGTVLARHSLFAWVTDFEGASVRPGGSRLNYSIMVALEVSHDGEHWLQLGHAATLHDECRATSRPHTEPNSSPQPRLACKACPGQSYELA